MKKVWSFSRMTLGDFPHFGFFQNTRIRVNLYFIKLALFCPSEWWSNRLDAVKNELIIRVFINSYSRPPMGLQYNSSLLLILKGVTSFWLVRWKMTSRQLWLAGNAPKTELNKQKTKQMTVTVWFYREGPVLLNFMRINLVIINSP